MASHRLREALVDLQTIIIVGLLYWLLREEQSNAFLRSWLSSNFPLGLYLLAPLTVVAVSGTLLVITAARIILFVKGDKGSSGRGILPRLGTMKKQLREVVSISGKHFSVLVLIGFGVLLAFYSYYVVSIVSLTALGISCIILGLTALTLPGHAGVGPGMKAMLHGATLSVEALLRQSAVRRATYLPPVEDGAVSAYVPLGPETELPSVNEMRQASTIIGGNDQKGVLVYPIGSELSTIPEFQDGLSLEERLRLVLVESANLCSSVMAEETGTLTIVGMKGADVSVQGQRYRDALGSLPSSIAACVIATLHEKPVTLVEEKNSGDRLIAVFRSRA